MAEGHQQPVIIKKIKKGGHGHHGGAWKVAYADFVTAMMAFFLLLWLLNAVTQEQLEGIADYFAPASISKSSSGADGVLGGKTIAVPGAMESATARITKATADLPPPKAGKGSSESTEGQGEKDKDVSQEEAEKVLREKEEEQFRKAEEELTQAIQSIPNLKQLAKSLMIDETPEGMRIQIVDQEGLAMFPLGSANMFHHTRRVLELVAQVILKMPQQIAITGHTDATKYGGVTSYGNWELSADRANASRRALEELGVPVDRVGRVVGKAETEPLLVNDPANPRNRRIAIVLLRGTGRQQDETKAKTAPPSALMKEGQEDRPGP